MPGNLVRDGRYAIRQLAATPVFAVVATLTLALGVGAATTVFSVVNGVLLRPLPYGEPKALVRVHEVVPQYGRFAVAPASFLDWREQNTVFERIAAYSPGSATYSDAGGPERVPSAAVSWDLFELLKVPPALGRGFTADEDVPGAPKVLVLSHGMWQQRFGGDPDILGRTVSLDGAPGTIVGVMPPGFYFPSREAEFWSPLALNPANATRGGHFLGAIARLKPDASLQQADAQMKTIAERLAVQYPESSADESAEAVALHDHIVGPIRPALLTLLAAVGVLILIACANVANLLLVRASVRAKELAIRTALGAGRGRLVRQMLVESLVLALTGGALGVVLAYAAVRPLGALSAGSIPRVADVSIDTAVLGFALLVSVLTGVLFGLAPAWQVSRTGVSEVLKDAGRSANTSRGRWVRGGLLVAQVALSIVLLAGATLLIRSFDRLTSVDPGFRSENVLAFRVSLPTASYPEPHQKTAFYDRLLADLGKRSSVDAAGMVQTLPMRGGYVLSFAIQGRPAPPPGDTPSAHYRAVSPGYFRALGIPLMRGRTFSDRDAESAPMVAVVDEAFARRHFPGEDPIGRGIDIGNGTEGFSEVVGVVGNVRHSGLDSDPEPAMYVPYKQDVFSTMWIVAKTAGDPAQLAAAARQAVRALDPGLPAYSVSPLAEVISESVAQRRFSMFLLGVFALIALFLAAVGLYGVVAYGVAQRTQEIGIRRAIGAPHGHVLRVTVGGGMLLALVGIAIGLGGALAVSGLLESMLFGVTPLDPVSYAGTAALLLAIAALACYIPARRALRVDPLVALRQM